VLSRRFGIRIALGQSDKNRYAPRGFKATLILETSVLYDYFPNLSLSSTPRRKEIAIGNPTLGCVIRNTLMPGKIVSYTDTFVPVDIICYHEISVGRKLESCQKGYLICSG
jgi:hypothetical protein